MNFKGKNKSRDLRSRLVKINEINESKKLLLNRLTSENKKPNITNKTPCIDEDKKISIGSKEFLIDDHVKDTIIQTNQFYLNTPDQASSKIKACDAYIKLAAIMTQMSRRRYICIVFSWPNGFEWPGLAHALANRAISTFNNSEKPGMRVGVYPFNRATYFRYKNTLFPSDIFLKEAQAHANKQEGLKNLSKRDHAFLTINSLNANHDHDINVPIRSIIPIFEWEDTTGSWKKLGDPYLKEVHSALRWVGNTKRQEKIDEYAIIQDDPELSEDGIFYIGRKNSPSIARKVLVNPKYKFDLIIFDSRQIVLRKLNNWRNAITKLAEHVCANEDSPPLLILCDDPRIYSDIRYQVDGLIKKKKISNTMKIDLFHIIREENSIWEPCMKPSPTFLKNEPKFVVKVTGKKSLEKINSINKLAKSLGMEHPEGKNKLLQLGGFLLGLIDTPIGQNDTRNWIKDITSDWSAQDSSRFASRYSWDSYKSRLEDRLRSLSIIDNYQVKKAIQAAQNVAEGIEIHTEIQLEIEEIARDAWINKKKMLIVVPLNYQIELVKWQMSKFLGKEYGDLIDIRDQYDAIEYKQYSVIAIAGRVDKILPKILLSSDVPETIFLYSSAYGAKRIVKMLKPLMMISEFSKIHPRAQEILQAMQEILSSMEQIGLITGEDEYQDDYHIRNNYDYEPSETYAVISLKQYGSYPASKFQTLIKYNPGNPASYSAVRLEDINEGDQILVLEDGLRDRMEDFLSKSGKKIEKDSKVILNIYLSTAKKNLKSYYSFKTRQKTAQEILNKMHQINSVVGNEVSVTSISRWIKWIEEHDHASEDEFQSYSAQNIHHFTVFAEALYINNNDAKMYFDMGIRKYRASRILDGRYIGCRLKEILTNANRPESMGLSIEQKKELLEMAIDNVYTIEMINYIDEEDVSLGDK